MRSSCAHDRCEQLAKSIYLGIGVFTLFCLGIVEYCGMFKLFYAKAFRKFIKRFFSAGATLTGVCRKFLALKLFGIFKNERSDGGCEIRCPNRKSEDNPIIRRKIRTYVFKLRLFCHHGTLTAPEKLGKSFVGIGFYRHQFNDIRSRSRAYLSRNIFRVTFKRISPVTRLSDTVKSARARLPV